MRDDIKRQQALEMRLQGLTYAEIGVAIGTSRQRAQQLVKPPSYIYEAVKTKANSRCEDCGVLIAKGHLHHTKSDGGIEGFNDVENLVYLCIACHMSDKRMAEHGFVKAIEHPKLATAQKLAQTRWENTTAEERSAMVPRNGGRPKGTKRAKKSISAEL